jgi:hypothetical protein
MKAHIYSPCLIHNVLYKESFHKKAERKDRSVSGGCRILIGEGSEDSVAHQIYLKILIIEMQRRSKWILRMQDLYVVFEKKISIMEIKHLETKFYARI